MSFVKGPYVAAMHDNALIEDFGCVLLLVVVLKGPRRDVTMFLQHERHREQFKEIPYISLAL